METLVDAQVQKTDIDPEETDYDHQVDTNWVEGYINRFTAVWKSYMDSKSEVDKDDISLADADLDEAIELDIAAERKAAPNALLRTLIQKMEKTATDTQQKESEMSSVSVAQRSRFSLEEGEYSSQSVRISEESQLTMLEYLMKHR